MLGDEQPLVSEDINTEIVIDNVIAVFILKVCNQLFYKFIFLFKGISVI